MVLLIPHIKSAYGLPLHCSWSNKAPMSPKRILNVDLPYLPKCTEFVKDFRKSERFQKFRLNRFLHRGSLTGKF